MASPAGSDDDAAAAVCCMCGDHGLPHELFRCSLCRLRLQHRRYCSDLYPRVPGPYRRCNWCLVKEDGGSPVKAPPAAGLASTRRLNNDRRDNDGDDQEEGTCGGGCTTRSVFSADPGKPVKKSKKKVRERAVQRSVAATAAVAKKRREPKAGAGGKARFKVKVRRYKLLAEVIC